MNGILIVLVAGIIGFVFAVLWAAKRTGSAKSTLLLVAAWSCMVMAMVYTGHMSVLVALANIAFLYTLLWIQKPTIDTKEAQAVVVHETTTDVEVKKPELADLTADDEAKLMEQAEHLRQVKITIENYFHSNLPFRKHGYSIGHLATDTGIPVYQLSAAINQEFGMNFNELINSYRVTYLTNILQDSFDLQSYTLEALGKMAGFNSRTTFIAAIKKHTGMTPSTFFKNKKSRPVKKVDNPEKYLMKEVA